MRASLRYFVVQVEWGGALPSADGRDMFDPAGASPSDLFGALRACHQEVFGDAGWGAVASVLAVQYYSAATRLAVVRCPAAREEECRATVAFTRAVRKRAVALHALQCVSTTRALKEALLRVTRGVASAIKEAQGATAVLNEEFFKALEAEAEDLL